MAVRPRLSTEHRAYRMSRWPHQRGKPMTCACCETKRGKTCVTFKLKEAWFLIGWPVDWFHFRSNLPMHTYAYHALFALWKENSSLFSAFNSTIHNCLLCKTCWMRTIKICLRCILTIVKTKCIDVYLNVRKRRKSRFYRYFEEIWCIL